MQTLQRGTQTSEFWMSTISTIVASVFPLLVAYSVLDTEQGALWSKAILGIAGVVVPIVVGSVAKNYNNGRVTVKTEAVKLEAAATQLEVMRLESLR